MTEQRITDELPEEIFVTDFSYSVKENRVDFNCYGVSNFQPVYLTLKWESEYCGGSNT